MYKILVIDNDYDVAELITDLLTVNGFAATPSLNGASGIESAIKMRPDLILCDINMPGVNGYDVLESLRQNDITHAIPFIFLTAKTDMQDLRKGMSLGADDYLTKPVSADELVDAISTRLEKHRQITRRYKAEIEQTRHRLEISKTHEDVTGLPKRSVLKKILTSDIAEDAHHAVFIIKLNRYKRVADIFDREDHQTLSRELISRIDKAVRREKDIFYLDEGEFGILFRDIPTKTVTSKMAINILSRIRKPITIKEKELNFTACVGIAMSNSEKINPIDLITNAELALNAAEENGFNTFSIYREALKKNVIDRINLESGLHKALERNELTIFYQPKIDSKSRKMIGLEALIRWQNMDYGLLSPTQFIPVAEENGLIIPIGEWLVETVCMQLHYWKSAGYSPPPVAVNISARQIEQKNFVNMLASTLKKTRITNSLLELELTESILISNSARTSKKLIKLRESGIKVAIDDFGTGYSSLSYLTNFPFDKLKIDQSFIRDISTDKAAAALATSIISMAHRLGVSVIAEGVETEEQLQLLEENNCDEIQGFYFSRPVPAEEIEPLLDLSAN